MYSLSLHFIYVVETIQEGPVNPISDTVLTDFENINFFKVFFMSNIPSGTFPVEARWL